MNPMINLNITLEKELELEREGLRRTRRYIGDGSQISDPRWYQSVVSQVAEPRPYLGEVSQNGKTQPHQEAPRSILARLFRLPRPRRQPACTEC